ncbi:sulfotransferase family 2 domain-containing protein [Aliiroseovarius sp.]|uniref:sulfotransferase family 2 domain-containing protein n=1 Tax=Aliiroseovarius sp. TaxID=1872442 RepID=UPI003BA9F5B2
MSRTYIGLHIPKCAGTSLLRMAKENLPVHQFYQNTSIIMNWRDRRPEFLDIQDYESLKLVWGHSVHEQMLHYLTNPVLFTGMRDPVERLVSEAQYQVDLRQRQGIPFDMQAWLGRQKNPMTWFIINRFPMLADRKNNSLTPFERAQKALQAFSHVYFTDSFAASANSLLSELGVSCGVKEANKGARKDIKVDVNLSNLKYDIALYEWARSEFSDSDPCAKTGDNDYLSGFLASSRQTQELESFLFNSMAGEYQAWGTLEEVLGDRLTQAMRILREVDVYGKRLAEK